MCPLLLEHDITLVPSGEGAGPPSQLTQVPFMFTAVPQYDEAVVNRQDSCTVTSVS